jgi:membrane-associated protease RseP (regulator of RpoE activity)
VAVGARKPPRYLLHAGLLLATFLTTTAHGAIVVHGEFRIIPIADGLAYSVPLMLILLCHELGHYIVARIHGVEASLPYFIPLLPGLGFGTLGAVISMRNVTSDRKKLIDIGAAGPLAGLAVAIPVLIYGIAHSQVVSIPAGGEQEGNSILYALLKHAVKGAWLPNGAVDINIHPTALAGWAGLLVTMINLLPVGQLDGGHVATAYFGNRYNRFAEVLQRLLPLGAVVVFGWVMHVLRLEAGAGWNLSIGLSIASMAALPWFVWYLLVSLVRRASGGMNHPPVDDKPLPRSRRALFWLMVIVFVGIFMPVPWRGTMVGAQTPPPQPTVSSRLP